jgi:hypothetical protein
MNRWDRELAISGMSPAALTHLARDGDEEMLLSIASASGADESTLHAVLDRASEPVRYALAWRREIPLGVLARCAADPSPRVRVRAAKHVGASAELLAALAFDEDPEVRAAAVSHAAAPLPAVLARTHDGAPEVRRAAFLALPASGDGIPEALAAVASDADPLVREAVAGHAGTPISARFGLAADSVSRVRRALARCDALDDTVLAELSHDADPLVRLLVVAHRGVPDSLLDTLAADPSADVRAAVAAHPRTGAPALLRLAADPATRVREAVAMRAGLSMELSRVLRERDDPVIAARLRERGDLDPRTT